MKIKNDKIKDFALVLMILINVFLVFDLVEKVNIIRENSKMDVEKIVVNSIDGKSIVVSKGCHADFEFDFICEEVSCFGS